MKKYLLLWTLFLLAILPIVNIKAEQSAFIDVYTNIVNPYKISKNLNGGFIELLLDYVNGFGGMWAQEIRDRGFEEFHIDGTTPYHWDSWFSSNENRGIVNFVEGGYNKVDRYQLMITGASKTESGVVQSLKLNDEVSHYFYIYARGENTNGGIAKIILFDEQNENRIFEEEINISGEDWIKTEFKIPFIPDVYSPNIVIAYKGEGNVYFDEVSLMPTNNFYGIRKEWADFIREWKPGNMRYPGGCWADIPEQRWEESIGHIDQRKTIVRNSSVRSYNQRYDFGLAEYMKICEEFDINPYLVTNSKRDILEASANFVEYCNSDTNTYWGKIRSENGHPEPYNVKLWEFGNEQWGDDNFVIDYANKFNTANDLMKAVDTTIVTIVNGNRWRENDFDKIMAIVGNRADIYGWHHATGFVADKIPNHRSENVYLDMVGVYHERFYIPYCEEKILQKYPNVKLANTEWWSQYGNSETFFSDWLLDTNIRNASLEAGIYSAAMYLLYMQNPQIMVLGNRTMGIGMFRRAVNSKGKKVIYTTPALPALAMCSNRRGDYIVNNVVESDIYSIYETDQGEPTIWLPDTKYLEVVTSVRDDSLYISVINRHPKEAMKTTIKLDTDIKSNFGRIYEMASDHYLDHNSADEPNKIKVVERDLHINYTKNSFIYSFPKHSVTILAIHIDSVNFAPPTNIVEATIYPNPTTNSNSFYINFETSQMTKKIDIHNSLGQVVRSYLPNFYSDKIFINNLNLAIGSYKIIIETSLERIYKNLIIVE